jgi:hypothetical protein
MRTLVGLLVSLAATTALADTDPATAIDDLAAARRVIAEGATCVPRALRPTLDKSGDVVPHAVDLQLGFSDGAPVLCAVAGADPHDAAGTKPVGTLACWAVDVAKRKLRPVAPTLLPGHPVPARLANGCTHGLCLPKGEKPEGDARVGLDDTGKVVGLFFLGHDTRKFAGYLFDRGSRRFVRKFELEASNTMDQLLFVGDRLVSSECAAGPTCAPQISNTAKPDETLGPMERDLEDLNTYLGTLVLLAPGVVAIGDAAWSRLDRLDLAAVKLTPIRHKKPSTCLDSLGDMPKTCDKFLRREVMPYAGASLIAIGPNYLAALSAPRAGDLVTLGARLAEKGSFTVYCAEAHSRGSR